MRRFALTLTALTTAALLVCPAADARADRPAFDDGRLSFSVKFKRETNPYGVLLTTVLPGGHLDLEIAGDDKRAFGVTVSNGTLDSTGERTWRWKAPGAKGLYPIRIDCEESGETMTLNAFVVVPIDSARSGTLNGYRIGDYFWAKPWDKPMYRPPIGLIEITPDLLDTQVSPHFTMRQFMCKQQSGYPKYIILRERMLRKLEHVLEATNAAGFRCDTFAVLSGYRTPFYNKAIGNVKYSRHVWGGAADIYIDEDQDGMMDDLDGNGRADIHDAAVLYKIIDGLYPKSFWEPFVGGLGRYKKTSNHGPFVHIDTRGERRRWGD